MVRYTNTSQMCKATVQKHPLRFFEQLWDAPSLPAPYFPKYLQVRHYISTQQSGHPNPLDSPLTEAIFKNIQHLRGILSLIYRRLLDLSTNKTLNSRAKWEQDLNFTFEDYDWEEICLGDQNLSYNSCHKLLQMNLIHRIYLHQKVSTRWTVPSQNCVLDVR